LRRALAAAATGRANLAVITGDLTDHGTLAEFQLFTEVIVAAPLPVEVLPGNHDHCGHRYEPDRDDAPRGGGSLAARR
jgi:3',5'-cyclic AMP phosphodiesterase CpdA